MGRQRNGHQFVPHQVTRLVFDTGQPYEQFRARYEAAVLALDEKRLAEIAARGARCSGSPNDVA
jgi:hypothetical protein